MSFMPNELVAKLAWDDFALRAYSLNPIDDGVLSTTVQHARLEIAIELRAMATCPASAKDCGFCSEFRRIAYQLEAAAQEEL